MSDILLAETNPKGTGMPLSILVRNFGIFSSFRVKSVTPSMLNRCPAITPLVLLAMLGRAIRYTFSSIGPFNSGNKILNVTKRIAV